MLKKIISTGCSLTLWLFTIKIIFLILKAINKFILTVNIRPFQTIWIVPQFSGDSIRKFNFSTGDILIIENAMSCSQLASRFTIAAKVKSIIFQPIQIFNMKRSFKILSPKLMLTLWSLVSSKKSRDGKSNFWSKQLTLVLFLKLAKSGR